MLITEIFCCKEFLGLKDRSSEASWLKGRSWHADCGCARVPNGLWAVHYWWRKIIDSYLHTDYKCYFLPHLTWDGHWSALWLAGCFALINLWLVLQIHFQWPHASARQWLLVITWTELQEIKLTIFKICNNMHNIYLIKIIKKNTFSGQ